jgi:hypothetical protein
MTCRFDDCLIWPTFSFKESSVSLADRILCRHKKWRNRVSADGQKVCDHRVVQLMEIPAESSCSFRRAFSLQILRRSLLPPDESFITADPLQASALRTTGSIPNFRILEHITSWSLDSSLYDSSIHWQASHEADVITKLRPLSFILEPTNKSCRVIGP